MESSAILVVLATKDPKKYVGGYSMRVLFQRGRELWGDLPPKLKEEEANMDGYNKALALFCLRSTPPVSCGKMA
jgi:hypothetical protein